MPAHNNVFPWLSYYRNYKFFEERMKSHSKTSNINKISPELYNVTLIDGRILKVFICECYSFGVAEYYETIEKLGHLDAIVINSNWCGYTEEAKITCRDKQVGLFDINGFMAAINLKNYWEYLTEFEKKNLNNDA